MRDYISVGEKSVLQAVECAQLPIYVRALLLLFFILHSAESPVLILAAIPVNSASAALGYY